MNGRTWHWCAVNPTPHTTSTHATKLLQRQTLKICSNSHYLRRPRTTRAVMRRDTKTSQSSKLCTSAKNKPHSQLVIACLSCFRTISVLTIRPDCNTLEAYKTVRMERGGIFNVHPQLQFWNWSGQKLFYLYTDLFIYLFTCILKKVCSVCKTLQ